MVLILLCRADPEDSTSAQLGRSQGGGFDGVDQGGSDSGSFEGVQTGDGGSAGTGDLIFKQAGMQAGFRGPSWLRPTSFGRRVRWRSREVGPSGHRRQKGLRS